MNLFKNFFHAFGDIIFGLAVVSVAVFLIGTQINDDFDIFALGNEAYSTVVAKFSGDEDISQPAEILLEPDEVDPTNLDGSISNEDAKIDSDIDADTNTANDSENTDKPSDGAIDNFEDTSSDDSKTDADNTSTNPVDTKENKIVPPPLPKIRNVQISSGSTAQEVASALFANEIIPSKEDFLAEYARLPAGRSITSGKFEIPTGSTSTEILSIIAP